MIHSTENEENDVTNTNEKGNHSLLSTFNRKRRHIFDVELKVERVLSLPYASGRFFFKIRLLNGGNHVYTSNQRIEIKENKVEFNQTDHFTVKMTSRVDNFTLDHCFCRISIRKEGRAGRSYEKIGFYDLDLATVAGCGDESKACLLNAYQQTNTNPANAYLEITMKLNILEGDHIFKRPDNDHRYNKTEESSTLNKKFSESNNEDNSIENTLTVPSSNYRGHSRQASKSSVCSNYSSTSINSLLEKNPIRTNSDEETSQKSQKRRTPFIDQFGDIQKRLQSTRIDVNDIVNSVMNNNVQTVENPNKGYLCLLYNEDGTARVGSSSYQSVQTSSTLLSS